MDDSEDTMELEKRIADFLARSAAYLGMGAAEEFNDVWMPQFSPERRRFDRGSRAGAEA